MDAILRALASGDWLDARLRAYSWILVALAIAGIAVLAATSDGLNDYLGRPLGTDFSSFYAAGTYVLEGRPEVPYDFAFQHARQKAIFGADTPFYGWLYPPFFLGLAAAFALMPYLLALVVWQGATFGLYLLTMRAIILSYLSLNGGDRSPSDRKVNSADAKGSTLGALHAPASPLQGKEEIGRHLWILLAVAFPAVFINLGHGQNGFLTTALIGGALTMLDRRPITAGFLFGLLVYKPQFGLMIPLVLVMSGRWQTLAAASVTAAVLVLATLVAFGPEVWRAFFTSTHLTRVVLLESGDVGWHKIQSVFSWVRMWGGSIPLAYTVQGVVALATGSALVWLWRSRAAFALKAGALALSTLIATPFSLDYDLILLAPVIAFLAADGLTRGFIPWEKTTLAALWIVPLIARSVAEATAIPLAVPTMLLAFVLILRRANEL